MRFTTKENKILDELRRTLPDAYDFFKEIIDKTIELEDYKRKHQDKINDLTTVAALLDDGTIWKSENVPLGMEAEAIVRLINCSERTDKRDFWRIPIYIESTTDLSPETIDVTTTEPIRTMNFRMVDKISYKNRGY